MKFCLWSLSFFILFYAPILSVLVFNVTVEQATDTVEAINISKMQYVQLQVTVIY